MSKGLLFKGKTYPVNFNMLVFRNWEKQTGRKFTEIQEMAGNAGAAEIFDILALLYFAVVDALEEKGQTFDFGLKQFIRGIDMNKIEEIISLIDLSEGEK